jgi:hypothetical protein
MPVSFQPQVRFNLKSQDCLQADGHWTCIASQAQSMAAVPTFTGDGGPILSLTCEQHTTMPSFWGHDLFHVVMTSMPQLLLGI